MLSLFYALWFGILTSISPCPLATNIAAISFLSKKINHPKIVLLSSIAYILGRMFAYLIIGLIIIKSLVTIPIAAIFLQKYMNILLGPTLIAVGLIITGIIKFNLSGFSLSIEKQQSLSSSGLKGAFALGVLFALSFCPISAALFFGSLIPLALKNNFSLIYPLLYGIGTGLPILIFSAGISLGVFSISHYFGKLTKVEKYMRKTTGIIFILVGFYYIISRLI